VLATRASTCSISSFRVAVLVSDRIFILGAIAADDARAGGMISKKQECGNNEYSEGRLSGIGVGGMDDGPGRPPADGYQPPVDLFAVRAARTGFGHYVARYASMRANSARPCGSIYGSTHGLYAAGG